MNGGRGAAQHQDHLVYLAKTEDGRVLRSSTILFRGEESVRIVGKPVSFMSREDKVRVIGFLNGSGAFLVTKAGQKACMYFGISKYTPGVLGACEKPDFGTGPKRPCLRVPWCNDSLG